ncbi:hypothetical protein GCM10027049_17900 [Mucilaginibacter puniceus]
MSILITSAMSANAQRLKALLNTEKIILGDHADIPSFMLQPGKMIKLPSPESDSYTHQMLALSLDNHISQLYALEEAEYRVLALATQLFDEYGIQILNGNEIY